MIDPDFFKKRAIDVPYYTISQVANCAHGADKAGGLGTWRDEPFFLSKSQPEPDDGARDFSPVGLGAPLLLGSVLNLKLESEVREGMRTSRNVQDLQCRPELVSADGRLMISTAQLEGFHGRPGLVGVEVSNDILNVLFR